MNPLRLRTCTMRMVLAMLMSATVAVADDIGIQLFENKIRPVLAKHCYMCHSAKALRAKKLKGGLRLDTRAGTRKGGKSGPAVVPGNLRLSLIVDALRHESRKMPPTGKLSEVVIADFVNWINMGAPDPRDGKPETVKSEPSTEIKKQLQFWAFQIPRKSAPPQTRDKSWPQSDIDRFVLAKLEASGLHPSPQADKRTLIRRGVFGCNRDLTQVTTEKWHLASDAFLN